MRGIQTRHWGVTVLKNQEGTSYMKEKELVLVSFPLHETINLRRKTYLSPWFSKCRQSMAAWPHFFEPMVA
jgi:hypothetical protein